MDKRFIGIQELADLLGISKNTVYSWTCQKRIPYLKVGRLVKFDRGDIEGWIKGRKRPFISESRN